MPVPLDEFHNRGMVSIRVIDMSTFGERRDDDERDAWSIAEEVDGLHKSRVIVAATFVKRDDEGGIFGKLRMPFEPVKNAVYQGLEDIQLGACGMAVAKAVRFQIRHREQMAMIEFVKEIGCVLDVG